MSIWQLSSVTRDLEVVLVTQWWFNLRTKQVEQDAGGPNSERLGPYDTEADARNALERAAARNADWDAQDEA